MAEHAHGTSAPEIQELTGSSKPGAAPRYAPKQAPRPKPQVRPRIEKQDDQHAPVMRLAKLHGLDAEVIELAERTEALALRECALWGRLADLDDAVTRAMPPRPVRPTMQTRMQHAEATVDGARTISVTEPPEWRVEHQAVEAAHAAALAEHERLEAETGARLGLPLANKLTSRASRRLARWGRRLAELAPRTYAGLRAKAAVLRATVEDGQLYDQWRQVLAVSVGADAIRLIEAEAEERFIEDRARDGELFDLIARHKDVWAEVDAVDSLYDAALEIYGAAEPPRPRALYWSVLDRFSHPTLQEKVPGRESYRLLYERKDIDEMRAKSDPPMCLSTGRADSLEGPGLAWRPDVQALARRDQILAAWDAWEAEKQALRDSSGVTAASDLSDKAYGELDSVHNRILTFQPRTFEGLQTKARWIAASPGPNRFAVHLMHDLCRMPAVAIPTMPAASETRPDARAVDAYHQFLHLELRYLEAERGMPGAVPWNTAANAFHDDARLPGHTPSTRAERVLALLGVDWTQDQRSADEVWPLPAIVESEAA